VQDQRALINTLNHRAFMDAHISPRYVLSVNAFVAKTAIIIFRARTPSPICQRRSPKTGISLTWAHTPASATLRVRTTSKRASASNTGFLRKFSPSGVTDPSFNPVCYTDVRFDDAGDGPANHHRSRECARRGFFSKYD